MFLRSPLVMGSIVSFLFFDGVDAFPFFGGLDFGVTLYLVVLLSRGFALFSCCRVFCLCGFCVSVASSLIHLGLLLGRGAGRCFHDDGFIIYLWKGMGNLS